MINEKKAKDMLNELDIEEGQDDKPEDETIQEELSTDMPIEEPKGLMSRRGEEL